MKKVRGYFYKLTSLKNNIRKGQILIGIAGLILFLVFGTNMYAMFLEEYIEGYKVNIRNNKILIKVRENRNLIAQLYTAKLQNVSKY